MLLHIFPGHSIQAPTRLPLYNESVPRPTSMGAPMIRPRLSALRSIMVPRLRRLASFLLVLALCSGLLRAMTLRPVNLEEMTHKAGRIVVGRCVTVEEATHPTLGIPILRVTLKVERSLKGRDGKTLTFQMAAPQGASSGVAGAPGFQRGEKVVVFLYPESRSGLTSPVGLGQGKFLRLSGKDGKEIVVNGFGNRSLLHGLSPEAARKLGSRAKGDHADHPDRLAADDLVRMVQELAP